MSRSSRLLKFLPPIGRSDYGRNCASFSFYISPLVLDLTKFYVTCKLNAESFFLIENVPCIRFVFRAA